MKIGMILKKGLILALLLALPIFIYAQELKPIKLPAPKTEGGKPLMQALKERKSIEELKMKAVKLGAAESGELTAV